MSCRLALDAASADESRQITAYIIECKNALGNMIGYKSKAAMHRARAQWKKTGTRVDKAKYDDETRRYLEHEKLYDKLLDDMLTNAKELNYDRTQVNPAQMVNDWRLTFSKRLRGEITPITIRQGLRTVKATSKLVDRIIEKRKQLLKKGKIPKKVIFGAPPELVASHADRFGFMQALFKKALTLSDRDISATSKYSIPIGEARTRFTDRFVSFLSGQGSKRFFNLNRASLWGVSGIDGLPFRIKGKAEDVYIVGEALIGNTKHWKIRKEDGTVETIEASKLNASEEEVQNAIIGLYRDELVNEIMDGQTRFILPSILNKELGVIEDEAGVRPDEDSDFGRAKAKVRQMAEAREKDEGGDRVPGVHTKDVVVGNTKWRYRYFMVKEGEGAGISIDVNDPPHRQGREQYKVYLLDKVKLGQGQPVDGTRVNFVGKTFKGLFEGQPVFSNESYTQEEVDSVFGVDREAGQTGKWYRSESINDFGRRLKTFGKDKGQPLEGSHTKQYTDFKEMEKPPVDEAMRAVWDLVGTLRGVFDEVWFDLQGKTDKLQKERAHLESLIEKQLSKQGKTAEEIEAYKKEMANIGGVDSRINYDPTSGILRTANTYSQRKGQNYIPHLYTYAAVKEQIMNQIQAIDIKIEKADDMGMDERVAHLKEGQQHLSELLQSLADNSNSNSMIDIQNIPYLKHITAWTDQTKRRKDGDIFGEYLSHSFRNLHRNEVIVDMMRNIHTMNKVTMPEGSIEYMTNRIKMAFGDSDTRATGMASYGGFADKLNNLPNWIRGGVTHDAESAERLVKWLTTPATMRFLGAAPSIGNQTQIVNTMIMVGFKTAFEAGKLYKKHKTKWDEVVQNTGVLNILTMFSDVMMVDGDPEWNDFAFDPIFGAPNPIKVTELANMLRLSRTDFINSDNDAIDNLLIKLEARAQGKSRAAIREMQDIRKMRGQISQAKLKAKRGQIYDFFTLNEKQSEELVTKRFKALVGEVTDAKLKRMVSWKLSWWFDGAIGGADAFTFTEGEKSLRAKTVVMALIDAQKRGILPGTLQDLFDGTGYEAFMTDKAKKIGRDAVYNTQFGMTPPHLGEGFNGLGRLIFQYKQYPTLQSIHDYQVFKKFTDGNENALDGAMRLTNAFGSVLARSFKQARGDKTFAYDVKDQSLDQEALAMLRFVFTRGIASAIGSIISVIPLLGRILRKSGGLPGFGMIRSAENPALGMLFRTMVWTALLAQGDDDDDRQEGMDSIFESFKFLLMPVFIGMIIRDISTGIDLFED